MIWALKHRPYQALNVPVLAHIMLYMMYCFLQTGLGCTGALLQREWACAALCCICSSRMCSLACPHCHGTAAMMLVGAVEGSWEHACHDVLQADVRDVAHSLEADCAACNTTWLSFVSVVVTCWVAHGTERSGVLHVRSMWACTPAQSSVVVMN